jgi:protein-S-isoprenylcysteine O-methyltransferase Ste14
MPKIAKTVCNLFLGAVAGFALSLALTAVPMAGIRRIFFRQTPEIIALLLIAYTWAIVFARLFACDPQRRRFLLGTNQEPVSPKDEEGLGLIRRVLRLSGRIALPAGLFFFFLYCASIALCQRLHMLLITQSGIIPYDVVRIAGIAVIVAGCGLQLKAVLSSFRGTETSQGDFSPSANFHLRHPVLLGWLLVLVGMPLAFGVWMPLVGIPGIYIVLRSWVCEQEEQLKELFGDSYTNFQRQTWRLIPFTAKG